MESMKLLNPNFFFLKDNYLPLYEECKKMDLAIVNEKYNDSVIISNNILEILLRTIVKSDNDDDLDKLIDKVCKLNSTASEIGLYIREIRMNSQRAINNSRRFSKSKAIKNAEMVYEVTSYFLYEGVNPLNPYEPPHYYDDWIKKEIAEIRALEEYESNLNEEEQGKDDVQNLQKVLDDFTSKTKSKLPKESQEQLDFINSALLELEKQNSENKELSEKIIKKRDEQFSKPKKSNGKSSKKVVIEVKTEKTPVIRVIMREDMIDEFKPVIDIDYVDD
ncbi:MAG: hypothetical protein Q4P18_00275 [Methanobrevibacter sp.]|uniref:hypothetical protein n=1 Tax=Methanobrevibacter sp. TaxID=66852 RepID=UPI0026DF94F1|nr:hypothetical protein [Methanobrevibacter sp.]MDO5847958.1 hypothetical protein [Methanobrevibacter sp.]